MIKNLKKALSPLLLYVISACLNSFAFAQAPTFQSAFSSNMVLPHGKTIPISGHAAANSSLILTVNGKKSSLKSDDRGRWKTEISALSVRETYTLSINDRDGAGTTIDNVLAGELWLCSGQSNMQYSVNRSIDQPQQYNHGHEKIRLLTVPLVSAPKPQSDFPEPTNWQEATDDTVAGFSAVCYFFARKRFEETGIPIGLINASWGGSAIEPWISQEALSDIDGYARKVKQLQQYQTNRRAAELSFAEDWVNWWTEIPDQGPVWEQGVLNTEMNWKEAPLQNWQTYSDKSLERFTGNLWFSTRFELTDEQAAKGARLVLGNIDEVDTTWINGKFINNTFGYGTRREYELERSVLKTGTNQITTFITNTWAAGGMTGPASDVGIVFDDGDKVTLSAGWKYVKVPTSVGYPPRAPWESVSGISGMYNAMISPLKSLKFNGVIWYQGESNAESANNYQALLAGLVKDWRKQFADKNLRFVIVQLPNFGTNQLTTEHGPAESGWAMMRHAQQQVALNDKKVGIVVTHDVGDDIDIHPKQKFTVGVRTAQVVNAFESGGMTNGVVPSLVSKSENDIVLKFSPPMTSGHDIEVNGFALCRKTGECVFAEASQAGNEIRINHDAMTDANLLRYCWSDGGQCQLKASNGTPVSSFELDLSR